MSVISIIGLAGSGKGTICRLISQNPGFKHIEMGEIIRKKIRENSLPEDIQRTNNAGYLIPDEYIFEILKLEIDPTKINLIDGAPRTETQMIELFKRYPDIKIIEMVVPREVAMQRLLLRKDDRVDDYPEAINRRFDIYEQEHSKFEKLAHIKKINADRDINEVLHDIQEFISNNQTI